MAIPLSKLWLQEFSGIDKSAEELSVLLTNAGLEVDSIETVSVLSSSIVVGCITEVVKHPEADKLNICKVDVGLKDVLTIVCGCGSVAVGLKVAVAKVGSKLSNGLDIKSCKLRGVLSSGMLCSEAELGLVESSSGIMHLNDDAVVGGFVSDYFKQETDEVLQVEVTPNRGDCLSVFGLAREVASIGFIDVGCNINTDSYNIKFNDIKVDMQAKSACRSYYVVKLDNLDLTRPTPKWIMDRLALFKQGSVNLFVDVINYVMFELGQPLHGYAFDSLAGSLSVRFATSDESISLLNDSHLSLSEDDLVIADVDGPIAIAGIMGSSRAKVNETTQTVLLESACFLPSAIATTCRRTLLSSDSAYRFERGVDVDLSELALQRAIDLLKELAGGKVIADVGICQSKDLKNITLSLVDIKKTLGVSFEAERIESILKALNCKYKLIRDGVWQVAPPSYRYDLNISVDLIEEVLRFVGFEVLPGYVESFKFSNVRSSDSYHELRYKLKYLGLYEHISYSFISDKSQKEFFSLLENDNIFIANPISKDMNVMRCSCWPGLIDAVKYNISRQQSNVRLFEIGNCFIKSGADVVTSTKISGVICGDNFPLQWGLKASVTDFFDIKGICQHLFKGVKAGAKISFDNQPELLGSALHPGQFANIRYDNQLVGVFGMLHPRLLRHYKLTKPVGLFEIDAKFLIDETELKAKVLSKYPSVRRDISILVDQQISFAAIEDKILSYNKSNLQSFTLFDLYTGNNLPENKKSMTIALFLRSIEKTLTDDEVSSEVDALLVFLYDCFGIVVREVG